MEEDPWRECSRPSPGGSFSGHRATAHHWQTYSCSGCSLPSSAAVSQTFGVGCAQARRRLAAGTRYRTVGVIVAPRELQVTTKTKSQDDTILVDGACFASTSEVLRELVRIRSGGDRLFPRLTLNAYEKILRDVVRDLGIAELEVVPHTFRHTGPSNDLYHGRRKLQDVAKRGRWANIKSVQRYSKSGRLLKGWRTVPAASRREWTRLAPSTGALLLAALRRLPSGFCSS